MLVTDRDTVRNICKSPRIVDELQSIHDISNADIANYFKVAKKSAHVI